MPTVSMERALLGDDDIKTKFAIDPILWAAAESPTVVSAKAFGGPSWYTLVATGYSKKTLLDL